jgi:hypothetical protein
MSFELAVMYMQGVLHNSYVMLYLEAALHWKIVRAPGFVLKGIPSKELTRLTSTAAGIRILLYMTLVLDKITYHNNMQYSYSPLVSPSTSDGTSPVTLQV